MQCGTAVSRFEVVNLQAVAAEILLTVVAYPYGEPVTMISALGDIDSYSRWNPIHGSTISALEL
jgi:hypothetical protein